MTMELRVHAGAASTRKDDHGYIAQARASSQFRGRRLDVSQGETSGDVGSAQHPVVLPPWSKSSMRHCDPSTFLDDTQLAYTALDSQLATSSLDLKTSLVPSAIRTDGLRNENSDLDQYKCPAADAEQGASSSRKRRRHNQPDSAVISQEFRGDRRSHSSYLQSPLLDRSARRQRSDQSSRNPVVHDKSATFAGVTSRLFDIHERAVVDEGRAQSVGAAVYSGDHQSHDAGEGVEVTSELPTSYSLSDITSESSRARKNERRSQSAHSPPCVAGTSDPVENRTLSDVPPKQAPTSPTLRRPATNGSVQRGHAGSAGQPRSSGNPSQGPGLAPPIPRTEAQQKDATVEYVKIPSVRERTGHQDVEAQMQVMATLSRTVKPPEPKANRGKFTTHITEPLRSLVEDPAVNSRYLPVSVIRDIQSLERGYWRVDCSPWALALQIDFWQFLEKTIRRGNAGWGVWCIRGVDDDAAGSASSIGVVKVFCWGEIVKHIYLMLWVASKAKVRKLGLQWLDSEEKIVVQMSGG